MNPAELTLTISPSLTKATPATIKYGISAATVPPTGRTLVERINVEPIYAQLKAALGDQWSDYKATIAAFILGSLNQAELSWVLQPLLTTLPLASTDLSRPTASILQLHNQLITAIYANTLRDAPASEVAPWVVATDKPSSTSKSSGAGGGANDKTEERLKREIMNIHPRDRQRIKSLKDEPTKAAKDDGLRQVLEYANELAVKPPGTGQGPNESQTTTPGLARSNFDIEIQRRYAQPLASEQLEFPAPNDLQNKIEPICYEQGLTGGVQQGMLQGCAELVEQACEVYIKEMLSAFLGHSRSNAVGKDGVQTHKFKRQLRREEDDADRGVLQRNAGGMLPVEMQMQAQRAPLRMADMRLALGLSDSFLKQDRFLEEQIMLKHYPVLDLSAKGGINGVSTHLTNGVKRRKLSGPDNADAMDIDAEFDYGQFKGVAKNDHDSVMSALDDCLLAAGGGPILEDFRTGAYRASVERAVAARQLRAGIFTTGDRSTTQPQSSAAPAQRRTGHSKTSAALVDDGPNEPRKEPSAEGQDVCAPSKKRRGVNERRQAKESAGATEKKPGKRKRVHPDEGEDTTSAVPLKDGKSADAQPGAKPAKRARTTKSQGQQQQGSSKKRKRAQQIDSDATQAEAGDAPPNKKRALSSEPADTEVVKEGHSVLSNENNKRKRSSSNATREDPFPNDAPLPLGDVVGELNDVFAAFPKKANPVIPKQRGPPAAKKPRAASTVEPNDEDDAPGESDYELAPPPPFPSNPYAPPAQAASNKGTVLEAFQVASTNAAESQPASKRPRKTPLTIEAATPKRDASSSLGMSGSEPSSAPPKLSASSAKSTFDPLKATEPSEKTIACPLFDRGKGGPCAKSASGIYRARSMQDHIRRTHPEHYIHKLSATEENVQRMFNSPAKSAVAGHASSTGVEQQDQMSSSAPQTPVQSRQQDCTTPVAGSSSSGKRGATQISARREQDRSQMKRDVGPVQGSRERPQYSPLTAKNEQRASRASLAPPPPFPLSRRNSFNVDAMVPPQQSPRTGNSMAAPSRVRTPLDSALNGRMGPPVGGATPTRTSSNGSSASLQSRRTSFVAGPAMTGQFRSGTGAEGMSSNQVQMSPSLQKIAAATSNGDWAPPPAPISQGSSTPRLSAGPPILSPSQFAERTLMQNHMQHQYHMSPPRNEQYMRRDATPLVSPRGQHMGFQQPQQSPTHLRPPYIHFPPYAPGFGLAQHPDLGMKPRWDPNSVVMSRMTGTPDVARRAQYTDHPRGCRCEQCEPGFAFRP
ncbi:uncharacterized protein RHO25_011543 [Cercospora beticola]|uniref:Uncharacterized protein n=3 Tax=Cercospora beticola TaxID=122368 RepID=A0ABZ0P507_CERBT|nr:hypothetical protein RHO25_011543 [Cercospora beticola]CAK1366808.1 unnamed protein product [Cercospora beticola]